MSRPLARPGAAETLVDDVLVAVAVVVAGGLCLAFRYLPMVDLPQHYAMVSIIANLRDPSLGFAERFTIDLLGRPYATVYLLGAGLARLVPFGAAMRLTVALCTVAPLGGLYALLRAAERPRIYALLAVPFAFGAVWHWGFLNFLLGIGLLLLALAQVVRTARRPSIRHLVLTGLLAVVVLFTHIHVLAVLLGLAPLFAWAFADDERAVQQAARTVVPLAPAAVGGVLFVALTWGRTQGTWEAASPGLVERLHELAPFLAGGVREPWPWVSLVALLGGSALAFLWRDRAVPLEPRWRRRVVVVGVALLLQVALYFVLPLNLTTVAFVSARHALLAVLFLLVLLPTVRDRWRPVVRVVAAAVAAGALVGVGVHLARFDREARDFDAILAPMPKNRRVAALIFESHGDVVHPSTFPYVHFAAYYQATRGGDILSSFASIWSMPVHYRPGRWRYPVDERTVWAPERFSFRRDLPHFDYLMLRGGTADDPAPDFGLIRVESRGAWRLYRNPRAVTPWRPPRE
jgi:hypothetical protein